MGAKAKRGVRNIGAIFAGEKIENVSVKQT
jgi:hypothetical protein